ncbi:ribonuclease toxin immunity protein CdiI [Psychrobacter phenylpyruvicus]|uniref:ribonuclease toxin immunity protein CdiI n=1 Tax=Psychrobacter phenylpyruvicus TaxID=29432 RepID=UPI001C49C68A
MFELGFDDPANRIYVTEQENFQYTKLACQRFVEIHPEHKRLITIILDNWMPLNSI